VLILSYSLYLSSFVIVLLCGVLRCYIGLPFEGYWVLLEFRGAFGPRFVPVSGFLLWTLGSGFFFDFWVYLPWGISSWAFFFPEGSLSFLSFSLGGGTSFPFLTFSPPWGKYSLSKPRFGALFLPERGG